jgi:hypothetical protein
MEQGHLVDEALTSMEDLVGRTFLMETTDGERHRVRIVEIVVGECLPLNMPEPKGHSVQIYLWCDSSHATDHVTRRSTTGIIIFVNGAPVRRFIYFIIESCS